MTKDEALNFIRTVKSGEKSEREAIEFLRYFPFSDVGCAKIDTQRALRNGAGEVIYGEGKTDDEILRIAEAIGARGQNILITRTNERVFERLRETYRRWSLTLAAASSASNLKSPRSRKATSR